MGTHKFTVGGNNTVFCEYCGIITFSNSQSDQQTAANQAKAALGCPATPKHKEEKTG